MMRKGVHNFLPSCVCLLMLTAARFIWADEPIRVVTTTSTFADIARQITGDKAEIYFIASPGRDIHFITPTPRDIVQLKKADVFIHAGLDLEAWRGPLLDAVGRAELMWPTGSQQIDVSKGITLLEVPAQLTRAEGDVHAYGNPHYWLDPLNGKIIAHNIAEGLARLHPETAGAFRKNKETFARKMDDKMQAWQNEIAPCKDRPIIVYHNTWPYFTERFRLAVAGFLEPKPGIPPTAKHFEELKAIMNEKKVKIIVKEVFHESRTPKKLAKDTGAAVITLDTEVGQKTRDYFSLFDHNIAMLVDAFSARK